MFRPLLLLLLGIFGCNEYFLHGEDHRDGPEDLATTEDDQTSTTSTTTTTDPWTEVDGCVAPVPDHVDLSHVVWAEPGVHFYVPDPTWAFASLHASRQLDGLGAEQDLRLSPSYFLATGLKESFLGCSEETGADPQHPEHAYERKVLADHDGCMQLESTTAWIELCRMYPGELDCDQVGHADVISSTDQDVTGRDNVESSMLAAAWYGVFGYAMLPSHGTDPDTWFAAATDPLAITKMVALVYNRGAWSGEIDFVLSGCQNSNIEDCVSAGSVAWDYVDAVGSYVTDMHAAVADGQCYDADVSLDDAHRWVDSLEPMFPGFDAVAAHSAVESAFLTASNGAHVSNFQQVAIPVTDALDDAWSLELTCPNAELSYWYGQTCP